VINLIPPAYIYYSEDNLGRQKSEIGAFLPESLGGFLAGEEPDKKNTVSEEQYI